MKAVSRCPSCLRRKPSISRRYDYFKGTYRSSWRACPIITCWGPCYTRYVCKQWIRFVNKVIGKKKSGIQIRGRKRHFYHCYSWKSKLLGEKNLKQPTCILVNKYTSSNQNYKVLWRLTAWFCCCRTVTLLSCCWGRGSPAVSTGAWEWSLKEPTNWGQPKSECLYGVCLLVMCRVGRSDLCEVVLTSLWSVWPFCGWFDLCG